MAAEHAAQEGVKLGGAGVSSKCLQLTSFKYLGGMFRADGDQKPTGSVVQDGIGC